MFDGSRTKAIMTFLLCCSVSVILGVVLLQPTWTSPDEHHRAEQAVGYPSLARLPSLLRGSSHASDHPLTPRTTPQHHHQQERRSHAFLSTLLSSWPTTKPATTVENTRLRRPSSKSLQNKLSQVVTGTQHGDGFGYSVALSGDTLVVGAPYCDKYRTDGKSSSDSSESAGCVYIFVKDINNWTLQDQLRPASAASYDMFGSSVAIWGDTIAVAAMPLGYDEFQVGGGAAVYVFERTADGNGVSWTQQAKLTANHHGGEAGGSDDSFWLEVSSVALSHNTLVVGEIPHRHHSDGSFRAHAWVFVRNDEDASWTRQAKLLVHQSTAEQESSSSSMSQTSVALDGDILAVGVSTKKSTKVSIFARGSDDTWMPQTHVEPNNAEDSFVGGASSLALSGTTLAVGASCRRGVDRQLREECVYVFSKEDEPSSTIWIQQAKLHYNVTTKEEEEYDVPALALSGDTLIVGGWTPDNDSSDSQRTYIFARSSSLDGVSDWALQTITGDASSNAGQPGGNDDNARDIAGLDWFGQTVAVSGSIAVVGGIGSDPNGYSSGRATLFDLGR